MIADVRPLSPCALQRPRSGDSDGEGGNAKKARVVWSVEMHQQFVNAVNTLGVDSAPPLNSRPQAHSTWIDAPVRFAEAIHRTCVQILCYRHIERCGFLSCNTATCLTCITRSVSRLLDC